NNIPKLKAKLFTTVPRSLFQSSEVAFSYHPVITDVGLVQRDAFVEDRQQTIDKLAELMPFAPSLISDCAELCRSCRLIICDVSCLGIEVGQAASIPSMLVENFNWDWIYSQMGPESGLEPYVEFLSHSYRKADYRIQTDPVCNPVPCDLHCGPMARRRTAERSPIRAEVAAAERKIVLISMGGVSLDLPFRKDLRHHRDYFFIVAGQNRDGGIGDNIRLLGPRSTLHHPDLINGADLLICKSGYSTIAECQQSGTPICCVARENFAESAVVERYVAKEMSGTVINERYFFSGEWLNDLEEMMPGRRETLPVNGADQAAEFICSLL
ncbi:MAG: hypothetical protein ACR2PH_17360, partial [Desulfobulbia bacterium]